MDDIGGVTSRINPSPEADLAARLGLDAKRRSPLRRWLIVGIVVLIAGAGAVALLRGQNPTNYVTQHARTGSLRVSVSATGTLAPRDQVDVGAEVSGKIDTVAVDFNDKVRKGQVLVQINTDQLQTQLRQARATHLQVQATVSQTQKALDRTRRLASEQAVSQQALENALADLDRAKAGEALARAQIDQLQTQLARTTIRSPIDGVVLDRKVEPGQTVVASLQAPVLLTLASDLAHMELDVDIDEADVGQVRIGQTASFVVDAYPGKRFDARLVSVHSSPKTVNGVVTYLGALWVDNPQGLLMPGMTATADIEVARLDSALLIPNSAFRFTPPKAILDHLPAGNALAAGEGQVWIRHGTTIEPRTVRIGITDSRETQAFDGLTTEDEVIIGLRTAGAAATETPSPNAVVRDALRPRGGGRPPGGAVRLGGGEIERAP